MLDLRLEANKNAVPDIVGYRIALMSVNTAVLVFSEFEIDNKLFGFVIQIDRTIPDGEIRSHFIATKDVYFSVGKQL